MNLNSKHPARGSDELEIFSASRGSDELEIFSAISHEKFIVLFK
jgi:hypothetical protein